MKRLVLTLFLAMLCIGATYANQIFYDTNGSVFNCSGGNVTGCGTDTIILGGTLQLKYVATSTSVTVSSGNPTTNANFGYLLSSCIASTTCDFQGLPAGLALNLNVDQTVTDPNTGAIPGGSVLGGGISGASSASFIQWGNNGLITFSGATTLVTYSLQNTTFGIVPPASCQNGSNCGQTTIQGTITDALVAAPEPAVSLLLATGLLAVGAFRRRK